MALVQQINYTTAVAPQLAPFRTLLQADTKWTWDGQYDQLFKRSKEQLSSMVEDGITLYDPLKVTLVVSDYCQSGLAFLMLQKHCTCPTLKRRDGTLNSLCCKTGWKVCMVGSRFTHGAEPKYTLTEVELLAVADAIKKNQVLYAWVP